MEKFKNIFRATEPEETEEAGIVDDVINSNSIILSLQKFFIFTFEVVEFDYI